VLIITAACSGGSATLAPGQTPAPPTGVSQECADATKGLTDALSELDSRLSVGMSFAAYGDKVGAARVAYDKIHFDKLDATCISGVGQPAEDAFNDYVRAYNKWNDCISSTGCSTDSIKGDLQAEWSKATALLDALKKRLP
jgi:hypothetical protein